MRKKGIMIQWYGAVDDYDDDDLFMLAAKSLAGKS